MSLSDAPFGMFGHELVRILPFSRRGHSEDQDNRQSIEDPMFFGDRSSGDLQPDSSGLTWADTLDLSQLGP